MYMFIDCSIATTKAYSKYIVHNIVLKLNKVYTV